MQIELDAKVANLDMRFAYLTEEAQKQMKEEAEKRYGSFWTRSLGEILAGINGDLSWLGFDISKPEEMTAIQFFAAERFRDFVAELINTLNGLQVPATPEAEQALKRCRQLNFTESTLIFCREYFGLPNFSSVDALTVDELLLAKKDTYNRGVFERGIQEINERKYAKK